MVGSVEPGLQLGWTISCPLPGEEDEPIGSQSEGCDSSDLALRQAAQRDGKTGAENMARLNVGNGRSCRLNFDCQESMQHRSLPTLIQALVERILRDSSRALLCWARRMSICGGFNQALIFRCFSRLEFFNCLVNYFFHFRS